MDNCRITKDPVISNSIKIIEEKWDKEHDWKLWPAQRELLYAFLYWVNYDMTNVPIRHLFLYPCCGATTLWLCVEKAIDDVVLIPVSRSRSHHANYGNVHTYDSLFHKGEVKHESAIGLRNKIVIVDGFGTTQKNSPRKLVEVGIKGILLS